MWSKDWEGKQRWKDQLNKCKLLIGDLIFGTKKVMSSCVLIWVYSNKSVEIGSNNSLKLTVNTQLLNENSLNWEILHVKWSALNKFEKKDSTDSSIDGYISLYNLKLAILFTPRQVSIFNNYHVIMSWWKKRWCKKLWKKRVETENGK